MIRRTLFKSDIHLSYLVMESIAGGIEEQINGIWGSKFTIAARDRIFEEVMRLPGLTSKAGA